MHLVSLRLETKQHTYQIEPPNFASKNNNRYYIFLQIQLVPVSLFGLYSIYRTQSTLSNLMPTSNHQT